MQIIAGTTLQYRTSLQLHAHQIKKKNLSTKHVQTNQTPKIQIFMHKSTQAGKPLIQHDRS